MFKKVMHKKHNKIICRHDYKNAIQVGNVDYQCPLCGKLLDPKEWFFMNSFEFIEVFPNNTKVVKRGGRISGNARKELEKELGRSVMSKENYLPKSKKIKRIGIKK